MIAQVMIDSTVVLVPNSQTSCYSGVAVKHRIDSGQLIAAVAAAAVVPSCRTWIVHQQALQLVRQRDLRWMIVVAVVVVVLMNRKVHRLWIVAVCLSQIVLLLVSAEAVAVESKSQRCPL